MTTEQDSDNRYGYSRLEYDAALSRRINPDLTSNQALVEGVVIVENADRFLHEQDPEVRAQIIADCIKTISKAQRLLIEQGE